MFTPQEVSEKSFPKASFGGYHMEAVDEFLDTLTEDYTTLYNENATLKAKLKMLAEKVEEYRATEEAMRSTLLSAQRMAAQMVEDAQAEKDRVLTDARLAAAEQIGELDRQKEDARRRMAAAQEELGEFIRRSHDLCAQQAAFLEKLPEMDLAGLRVEEPAVSQDTVRIDKAMLQELSGQADKSEPAEEPAVQPTENAGSEEEKNEPAAEPKEQPLTEAASESAAPGENPFSSDFHLDLDELKFGRNYNGEDK